MRRLYSIAALLLGLTFVISSVALAVPSGGNAVNGTVTGWRSRFQDDFSTNTAMWTYYGSAARTGGYMQLTPAVNGQVGRAWYTEPVSYDFRAEFDWRVWSGSGADGLCFLFYKKTTYLPSTGGGLGFIDNGGNAVPGYGIEFDNYLNSGWDANNHHIALMKDSTWNHLAQVSDTRVADGAWHHTLVTVENSTIKVYVDNMNTALLSWTGTIDRTFNGFGFAAGTGGLNYNQAVDNVRIWQNVAYTVEDGQVTSEVVFIQGEKAPYHETAVAESSSWDLLLLNTFLVAIAIIVIYLITQGRRKENAKPPKKEGSP